MAQLRVTPDQLRNRAGECRKHSEEIGEVITSLDSLKKVLESEWEGNRAKKYFSQYDDLRPSFVSMRDLVSDLATELDNEATRFENADS